jgi:hypothetical protein
VTCGVASVADVACVALMVVLEAAIAAKATSADAIFSTPLPDACLGRAAGLVQVLAELPDPRRRRGIRHRLVGLVAVAVTAVMAGARSYAAMGQWASELPGEQLTQLGLTRSQAPDESTFRRVFSSLDAAVLDALVGITRSVPHGHVSAVHAQAAALSLPAMLGPAGRHRDLALALIVSRVVHPGSKLATACWWEDTTLGVDLGVAGASTDEVYAVMDWLLARQDAIEATLARRHLAPKANPTRMALFDLSSSWLEGSHCPLGRRGYSRDGKEEPHPDRVRPAHRPRRSPGRGPGVCR